MRALRWSLLALLLGLPVQAAVFTVTKTADTLDGACDHDCSLREAVSAANAANGVDVVKVPEGIYTLSRTGAGEDANSAGDLDISDELLLVGAGAGSTILDGFGADRVLDVRAWTEIFGVTIRNGRVEGDGGGLLARSFSLHPVYLRRSVVSGNLAQNGGDGGGIATHGGLQVSESAILENQAEGDGGGISAGRGEGYISLTNVTVSGNRAAGSGGGLAYTVGQATILSSTVVFNQSQVSGGGIFTHFPLIPGSFPPEVFGSIVAQNTAPEFADCPGNSGGYNVIGADEGCGEPTDRSGTAAQPLRPVAETLSTGLGPTPVHALLEGSPALDMVPAAHCPSADQVGQARTAPCDAGAWERVDRPVCVPGGPVLCLQEGRFRVTAGWRRHISGGDAQADPLTDDTGNFWFFSPDNLEVMVKVLDGYGLNQRWWVFTSGLTDVGVDLKVEDLETGRSWTHTHPTATIYAPVLDTGAFPCTAIGQASLEEAPFPGLAPAILVVTKTADTFDGACDHDCSLREAVAAANAREGLSVIVAGPGVYSLTRLGPFEDASATGDLDTLRPLVIFGAGAARTIFDGAGIDRVLHGVGPGVLEVHRVTVRNGWARGTGLLDGAGGGVFSWNPLTLVDSVISGNRAEHGGGIWTTDLTARGTTIAGNVGIEGGGIGVYGTVHLSNVTLSGNLGRYGGGMFRLVAMEDDSEIADTTVTGNAATVAGGGLYTSQDITCPASHDDDLCPNRPYIRVARSVVAGNSAPAQPDCANLENEGGDNVFGVGDSCLAGPTDVAGTLAAPLDPRLTPLADHGGPTPTHVPLADSPALDLGPLFSCPAVDQRGRPRPAGAGCDAGSVELLPSACQPDEDTLCLGAGDRFQVTARWTAQGKTAAGKAVPLRLDSGAFWFFDPANVELTVKVLDGCGLNDRYWVFLTGLTDVGVEVEVEDLQTGRKWTHTHAACTPLQPRLDTNALDSCG